MTDGRSRPLGRVGPYVLVRSLGAGGMGEVYEARHPEIPRPLALKRMLLDDPEALLRFQREAEALARLHHPRIVRVHAFEAAPPTPFLVTELVEGEPLSARLPLEPEEAARLLRELAGAVEALHAVGLLHRDLKPDNVLVRPDGTPVLIDFGLARARGAQQLTQTGEVVGTPAYMAPEQAESAQDVDRRADVYGLGAILFACLTGRAPFEGSSVVNVLHQVLTRTPEWSRVSDPDLARIGRKAMAMEAEARFPDAASLQAALDGYLEGARAPRSPWVGRAVVGAALVLVGSAAFAMWPEAPAPVAEEPEEVEVLAEVGEAPPADLAELLERSWGGSAPYAVEPSSRPSEAVQAELTQAVFVGEAEVLLRAGSGRLEYVDLRSQRRRDVEVRPRPEELLAVGGVAWDPPRGRAVLGCSDGLVWTYAVEAEALAPWPVQPTWSEGLPRSAVFVREVAVHPESGWVALGATGGGRLAGGWVQVWSPSRAVWLELRHLASEQSPPRWSAAALAFSGDGRWLAAGFSALEERREEGDALANMAVPVGKGQVVVWDLAVWPPEAWSVELGGGSFRVNDVTWSGERLWVGTNRGEVEVFERGEGARRLASLELRPGLVSAEVGAFGGMAWVPVHGVAAWEGRLIACTGEPRERLIEGSGHLYVWEADGAGREVGLNRVDTSFEHLELSPDGSVLMLTQRARFDGRHHRDGGALLVPTAWLRGGR